MRLGWGADMPRALGGAWINTLKKEEGEARRASPSLSFELDMIKQLV
jgi:hypothetical protein